jgi:hypothetical protein
LAKIFGGGGGCSFFHQLQVLVSIQTIWLQLRLSYIGV